MLGFGRMSLSLVGKRTPSSILLAQKNSHENTKSRPMAAVPQTRPSGRLKLTNDAETIINYVSNFCAELRPWQNPAFNDKALYCLLPRLPLLFLFFLLFFFFFHNIKTHSLRIFHLLHSEDYFKFISYVILYDPTLPHHYYTDTASTCSHFPDSSAIRLCPA